MRKQEKKQFQFFIIELHANEIILNLADRKKQQQKNTEIITKNVNLINEPFRICFNFYEKKIYVFCIKFISFILSKILNFTFYVI
jgi:hypothetical protein